MGIAFDHDDPEGFALFRQKAFYARPLAQVALQSRKTFPWQGIKPVRKMSAGARKTNESAALAA
jgi:hypothetical protein